jgi:undecaprenyl-diphosphatase
VTLRWRTGAFNAQVVWVLAAMLFVGGALWVFAEIADEVVEGEAHVLDRSVLLALRDPHDPSVPIGPSWLTDVARDITSLGGGAVLTLLTLAAVGFLLLNRQRSAALLVAAAVTGGALISLGLKIGFDRPRPDLVPHAMAVYYASFPSGHAMLASTTYLTLGALLAQVQSRTRVRIYLVSWALLLSILVGASRILLGVHWPTDVLAGWCLGSAWSILCVFAALWLQRVDVRTNSQSSG